MCGIVGYIGQNETQQILINGLQKLEYRGYDSAGIAIITEQGLEVTKAEGRLERLEAAGNEHPLVGTVGIGHTRWATHGKPSYINSHPHVDNSENFAVVHNGIIENYMQLKEQLISKGHQFNSETDTEVIVHLIAEHYNGDLVQAVQQTIKQLQGAFALGVLSSYEPDKLIAVRQASPLIVGVGSKAQYIGSDIPAILEHTRDIYILEDGEMAILTVDAVQIMSFAGEVISKEIERMEWDITTAEKAGYDYFMLKEIFEQPRAYRDTMRGKVKVIGDAKDSGVSQQSGVEIREKIDEEVAERIAKQADVNYGLPAILQVQIEECKLSVEKIQQIEKVHIVACGTAYHAGLIGKSVIESCARIATEVDVASEYRYRSPMITPRTLVIVVSQSGETADTLAALREAKQQGAHVLAITNVVGSSIAREADDIVVTGAGPEIAVASTKAYTTQLIAFFLLGIYFAQLRQTLPQDKITNLVMAVEQLPALAEQLLTTEKTEQLAEIARRIALHHDLFFIGRGVDYAVAQEGSLKLKEISYIHSEAYAAGELKHGTLALIEQGTPVIALMTQPALFDKTMSNIKEVKARGAHVLVIAYDNMAEELAKTADEVFTIPMTEAILSPALSVIPLQLLAYYTALTLGHDIDKPRNLAKSVTVE
ncbi:glutamine--fructose-6-phosphate transaminase (isomerizing) [Paenibacillus yanchengensis]|uniref:Glutamine--fructose-6-phosphate aminotransferase [isomerizing] n=1 Tax=Paenibacillus yanchengensis TaxID=2035833 RepID=A0ABW4YJA5_9BACL